MKYKLFYNFNIYTFNKKILSDCRYDFEEDI